MQCQPSLSNTLQAWSSKMYRETKTRSPEKEKSLSRWILPCARSLSCYHPTCTLYSEQQPTAEAFAKLTRFAVASPSPKMDAPLELRPIFHICRTAGTSSSLLIYITGPFYTWFVSHTSKLPVTTFFKGFHRVNQLSQSSKQFLVHRYDPGTSEYRAPVEAKRREDPPRRRPHAAEQSWPLFLEGIL